MRSRAEDDCEGMSFGEIGAAFGLTEGGAFEVCYRGIRHLWRDQVIAARRAKRRKRREDDGGTVQNRSVG